MANTQIYWIHTLSPVHVGTGRGAGYIDLPIHRDKVTNWPLIPGSTFKGVWADHFRATNEAREKDEKLRLAFGRADNNSQNASNESNAGALIPTDARLVCLPVRSFHGTFAWCTSPLALQMLSRDLSFAGETSVPQVPADPLDRVLHTKVTKLKDGGQVYFEDLNFEGQVSDIVSTWATWLAERVFPGDENKAWRTLFEERFVVVPDSIFDFFTETGTEVATRVRIDSDSKTVASGQLWNEESLPAESILVGVISCDRVYARPPSDVTAARLVEAYATKSLSLQVGGKATVGRGRVRCVFSTPKEAQK